MSNADGAKNFFYHRYCDHVKLSPEEKSPQAPEWQKELRSKSSSPLSGSLLSSSYDVSHSPEAGAESSGISVFGMLSILNSEHRWKTRYCEVKDHLLVVYRRKTVVAAVDLRRSAEAKLLPPSATASAGVFANSKWNRWKQSEGFVFSMRTEDGRYFKAKLPDRDQAMWWVRNINMVRQELRDECTKNQRLHHPVELQQGDEKENHVAREEEDSILEYSAADEPDTSTAMVQHELSLLEKQFEEPTAFKASSRDEEMANHHQPIECHEIVVPALECDTAEYQLDVSSVKQLTDEGEQHGEQTEEVIDADAAIIECAQECLNSTEQQTDNASQFFAFSPDADVSNTSSCFSQLHHEAENHLYSTYPHYNSGTWKPDLSPTEQQCFSLSPKSTHVNDSSLMLETDDDSDDAGSVEVVEIYRLEDIVNGTVQRTPSSCDRESDDDSAGRKWVHFTEEQQRDTDAMEAFLTAATLSHDSCDTPTKLSPIKPARYTQLSETSTEIHDVLQSVNPQRSIASQKNLEVFLEREDMESENNNCENSDPNIVTSNWSVSCDDNKILWARSGAGLRNDGKPLKCIVSGVDEGVAVRDAGKVTIPLSDPLGNDCSSTTLARHSSFNSSSGTVNQLELLAELEQDLHIDTSAVENSMIQAKRAFVAAADAAIDAADAAQIVTRTAISSDIPQPVKHCALEAANAAVIAADTAIIAATVAAEVSSQIESFRVSFSSEEHSAAATARTSSGLSQSGDSTFLALVCSFSAPTLVSECRQGNLVRIMQLFVLLLLFSGVIHYMALLIAPHSVSFSIRPYLVAERTEFSLGRHKTVVGGNSFSSYDWEAWRTALAAGDAFMDPAMLEKIQRITTLSPDTPEEIKIAIMHHTRKGTLQPTSFTPSAYPSVSSVKKVNECDLKSARNRIPCMVMRWLRHRWHHVQGKINSMAKRLLSDNAVQRIEAVRKNIRIKLHDSMAYMTNRRKVVTSAFFNLIDCGRELLSAINRSLRAAVVEHVDAADWI